MLNLVEQRSPIACIKSDLHCVCYFSLCVCVLCVFHVCFMNVSVWLFMCSSLFVCLLVVDSFFPVYVGGGQHRRKRNRKRTRTHKQTNKKTRNTWSKPHKRQRQQTQRTHAHKKTTRHILYIVTLFKKEKTWTRAEFVRTEKFVNVICVFVFCVCFMCVSWMFLCGCSCVLFCLFVCLLLILSFFIYVGGQI